MTVYSGTQKISMGRNDDTDYKSKRAAAMAQAGQNQYIQGVQAGIAGVGKAVAADRTVYGNSNIPVGEILNPKVISHIPIVLVINQWMTGQTEREV